MLFGNSNKDAIYITPCLLIYPTISEVTSFGVSFTKKTMYNVVNSVISWTVNIDLRFYLILIYGGAGFVIATEFSYIIFFILKTFISRKIWWSFNVNKYTTFLILITFNCILHTFYTGISINFFSAITLIIVFVITFLKRKK